LKKYCFYRNFGIALSFALLAGCAESPAMTAQTIDVAPHAGQQQAIAAERTQPEPDGAASVPEPLTDSLAQAGTPQSANDRAHAAPFWESGVASWYGKVFQGRRTASGERYDAHALTAAHRTLPLGSYVRVTAVGSSRSVVVRINDRGPYTRGRVIDLSYAAAAALDLPRAGTLLVKIERIGKDEAGT
jgi:rare lipoprotein A